MERLTAVIVLALGAVILMATAYSVAVGVWETTLAKTAFLLLVVAGMYRATGHLRGASSTGAARQ